VGGYLVFEGVKALYLLGPGDSDTKVIFGQFEIDTAWPGVVLVFVGLVFGWLAYRLVGKLLDSVVA
jgi:hypothetical protein